MSAYKGTRVIVVRRMPTCDFKVVIKAASISGSKALVTVTLLVSGGATTTSGTVSPPSYHLLTALVSAPPVVLANVVPAIAATVVRKWRLLLFIRQSPQNCLVTPT